MSETYRAVVSALNHPDVVNETWGLFNERSLSSLHAAGVELDVMVPRPYAPPVGPFSSFSRIPDVKDSGAYRVHHPRFWYFLPKRYLYGVTGRSFSKRVTAFAEEQFARPDVAHGCHLYPDGYTMMTYASEHDVPLTTVSHGTLLNEFDDHPASVQRAIRAVLRASDRVLCVSHALQRKASEIEPRVNAEHLPLGATPAHFPTDRRRELRQELDVPVDATVVLYCGHFSEAKGVADLLRVLPTLTDESLYFAFIGHGGDLRWDLVSALSETQTPGRVLWKRDPVTVRRWFALADTFVLPSYSEGRPTVVYEAMASATPVIASRVGGIPEQVVDGETGWLFDAGDVQTLARLLDSLSVDELRRRGENGLERLREQGWTWEAHADRLTQVHEELIDG